MVEALVVDQWSFRSAREVVTVVEEVTEVEEEVTPENAVEVVIEAVSEAVEEATFEVVEVVEVEAVEEVLPESKAPGSLRMFSQRHPEAGLVELILT